jgi:hypothetical protein
MWISAKLAKRRRRGCMSVGRFLGVWLLRLEELLSVWPPVRVD